MSYKMCILLHFFPPHSIKLLLKLLCIFASRKFGSYIFHLNVRIGSNVGKLVLWFFFKDFKPHTITKSWRNSYLTPPSLPSELLTVWVFPSAVLREPQKEAVSTPWERRISAILPPKFPLSGVWLECCPFLTIP